MESALGQRLLEFRFEFKEVAPVGPPGRALVVMKSSAERPALLDLPAGVASVDALTAETLRALPSEGLQAEQARSWWWG